MDERYWNDVVSGRRRGGGAAIFRGLLSLAEPVYAVTIALRNLAYDAGWFPVSRLSAPVISIGNITTGGTGKTPVTAWLAQWALKQGYRPGILSRGFRALDETGNDEKRLLDQLCPGVPHLQNRDRIAAGQQLLAAHPCDVVILDDGFQHRRLHRDGNVVLIDCLQPWGFGHLLPRGALRESLRGLARADVVLVTRSDQLQPASLTELRAEITRWTSAPVYATRFGVTGLADACGRSASISSLQNRRVGLLCGIGNPRAFLSTLQGVGIDIPQNAIRIFPDHHHYSACDLQDLSQWCLQQSCEAVITTRKDLVKLPATLGECPVWGVDIALQFIDPVEQSQVEQWLDKLGFSRAGAVPGANHRFHQGETSETC